MILFVLPYHDESLVVDHVQLLAVAMQIEHLQHFHQFDPNVWIQLIQSFKNQLDDIHHRTSPRPFQLPQAC